MNLPTIDLYDGLTLAGLALLAVGLWLLVGWAGLLALLGALLLTAGIMGAMRAGRV